MNNNPKLWIFGDSWSSLSTTDPSCVWTRQLAHKLALAIGQPITLHNTSLIGSAQDWALMEYVKVLDQIRPEDYMVFLLTSPTRYWYFEDLPSVSNWNILDFDSVVGKDRARAVEAYIKYIQRPEIDELNVQGRLSTIAYETRSRRLRNPLILKGFEQELGLAASYSELNISLGDLAEVQNKEYQNLELVEKLVNQGIAGYFRGSDCRYNHLCLRNHDILADKLVDALVTNTSPDLSTGFYEAIVEPDWHRDEEFCQRELKPEVVEYFKENLLGKLPRPSWQARTGINKIMNAFPKTQS